MIAIDAINSVKDYVQGRALVVARTAADAATLAQTDIPLKTLTV